MSASYKYKWSKRFSVPAQVFGEFYYSLKKRTPEELVRAAKSPRSPVHKLFQWDDKAAAHEHRLMQARVMVNSLQVEIISPKGKPSQVIAFIRSSDRGRHVPTMEATKEDLNEALQECWRDMLAFRARYKNLEIAQGIIQAIDDVDRRLRRSTRKAA
jgi:hypothetical protein